MRFLDASIVVHAVLRLPRDLKEHEKLLKAQAGQVMQDIDGGTKVSISVVHLNEIANKLSHSKGGIPESHKVIRGLLGHANIQVLDVSRPRYAQALSLAEEKSVDIADALAWVLMEYELKIQEVYTTNRKHFAGLSKNIKLLP